MITVSLFRERKIFKKMCNDMLCRQITDIYVCQCLLDEVVKIKFSSQARCHQKVVRSLMLVEDQNRHLYSVYFNSLSQRVVLCGSCAGAFMIMANGKKFVLISRQSCVMMIIKK